MKCGTTAVKVYLNRHSEIETCSRELNFFDKNWDLGHEWYRSHFSYDKKLAGEKSPSYLASFRCHGRMASLVPKVKLIILARDPTDRAVSQWRHHLSRGKISKSFADFAESGIARPVIGDGRDGPVWPGMYLKQIEKLLQYYPRESLYVGISERLKAAPLVEFNKIFDFLGVKRVTGWKFSDVHTGNHIGLSSGDRGALKRLREIYAPENDRLRRFLDDDIVEWNDKGRS
jgi:hypothetical protein